VCYLNDILVYSTNEEEHEDHLRKVLERLREFGHYAKAEKFHFGVTEGSLHGFVTSPDGIGMKSDRISTIDDWPTQESVRYVQMLLRFKNFDRPFTRKYAKVTTPISDLLKKAETSRTRKQLKWEWTRDAELAFRKLKRAFTSVPILNHFEPAKPIILHTDASGFTIDGLLNQYDSFGILRLVNFYS
jgi:hypothetical protein